MSRWRTFWRWATGQPPTPVLTFDAFCGRIPRMDLETWCFTVLRQDPCCYCGGRSETVEHITPKSVGGRTTATNLVGACSACNCARSSYPLLVYLLFVGRIQARMPLTPFRAWYGNLPGRIDRRRPPPPPPERRVPRPLGTMGELARWK